jgi:AGCS family alanine or glycine:cation symporter
VLEFFNRYIFGVIVPLGLMAAGVFYAWRLRGLYLRHPGVIIRGMLGRGGGVGMPPGRALSLALAGTLGVGNIVGVASAIYLGGFGAVFWMWVSALAAMLLKYAETVIALNHRRLGGDGLYHGGPMFYIRDFFDSRGLGFAGRLLAVVFALLCIIDSMAMGCVIQVNAVTSAFYGVMGLDTALCGGVFTFLAVAVIVTGARGISELTERLVPLMTIIYIVLSLAVMLARPGEVFRALGKIFAGALAPASAGGGAVGYVISRGVRFGVMRGLMSNEAGCGTAPIAHAGSSARYPSEQGFWGIFEVFVDTILLCSMTAIVVIIGYDKAAVFAEDSMMMTLTAYSSVLGGWSEYCMCAMVLFFGFATVICWAHYGMECVRYLSGRKVWIYLFISAYGLAMLWGAVSEPGGIWGAADLALGAMTLLNLCVICPMSREVMRLTEDYIRMSLDRQSQRKAAGMAHRGRHNNSPP